MASFRGGGLKLAVVVALAAAMLPATVAAQQKPEMSSQAAAETQAAAQRAQLVSSVEANRAGAIQSILSQWKGSLENAAHAERVQSALQALPSGKLADIMSASSYDEVRTILSGGSAVSLDAGILDLGALTTDLTYTPINPPCRAIDTRNIAGNPIPGGSIRNWILWGGVGFQGGNPAGCPNPLGGGPLASSVNLTALPAGGAPSHLRIYPYLAVFPTVAFLSYTTVNLSNAGIVAMCPGVCAFDVTIYNATTVNYALDVMGFFYRATENPLGLSQTSATTTIGAGCTNYAGGNVSITVPGPGYITVTAQAWMRNFTAGSIKGFVYIGSTAVDCTFASPAQGYVAQVFTLTPDAGSVDDVSVPLSRSFFVGAAGTYTYYLNAQNSTGVGTFWFAAMQARYSPQ